MDVFLAPTEEFQNKNILNEEAGPSKNKQKTKQLSHKALFLALLLLKRSKGV